MTDSARAQLADRLHLDDSPRRAIRVGAIVAFLFFVVGWAGPRSPGWMPPPPAKAR